MLKIACETNNLADVRRLQKIKMFNDPNYKYEGRRRKSKAFLRHNE
jgi:hypothetical protein